MMKKCAIFSIVKNEKYFLPKWIKYYSQFFEKNDIYILDHESTDGSTENIDVNVKKIKHNIAFDHGWLNTIVPEFQRELLKKYEVVIFTEIDEFIYSLDFDLNILIDCFIKTNDKVLTATGYDIKHNLNVESDLKINDCIIENRNFWYRNKDYDKTLISKIPLYWGIGFHICGNHDKNYKYNLHLMHLHKFDFKLNLERHINRIKGQELEKPWTPNINPGKHNKTFDENEILSFFESIPAQSQLELIPEKHKLLLSIV